MLGRRNTPLVGLDVGSSAVKMVELRRSGTTYGLVAAGIEPLPHESVIDGAIGECPTGSRKSAATVNTSYPTFCISAMLSSSRSRCAFSIQRCS